jgi:hypothetical protein
MHKGGDGKEMEISTIIKNKSEFGSNLERRNGYNTA